MASIDPKHGLLEVYTGPANSAEKLDVASAMFWFYTVCRTISHPFHPFILTMLLRVFRNIVENFCTVWRFSLVDIHRYAYSAEQMNVAFMFSALCADFPQVEITVLRPVQKTGC